MHNNHQPLKDANYLIAFRSSVWCIGFAVGIFSVVSQGIVSIADGYLSTIDLTHLVIASLVFTAWVCLKPHSLVVVRAIAHNSNPTI